MHFTLCALLLNGLVSAAPIEYIPPADDSPLPIEQVAGQKDPEADDVACRYYFRTDKLGCIKDQPNAKERVWDWYMRGDTIADKILSFKTLADRKCWDINPKNHEKKDNILFTPFCTGD